MQSSADSLFTLIDGRSGSGKSTLALRIARSQQALLISLDDIYPGWDGLDAGSWHVYQNFLFPRSQGLAGSYRPWDWERKRHRDKLEIIPDGRPVVVEGCGSIRSSSQTLKAHCIWVELDDSLRHQRAVRRDGPETKKNWGRWARQEDRFFLLHRSRDIAHEIFRSG